MAVWGPANGNFKHGFCSAHNNEDRTLGTALATRTEWLRAIENVLAGHQGDLTGSQVRQVQKIIDERPSWAEFVIRRFKGREE